MSLLPCTARLPRLASSLVLACAAVAATPVARAEPEVAGEYDSPLGRLRVSGDGTTFSGWLVTPSGPCRLRAGDQVLKGTLLDDSLAGEVRLCQTGCGEAETWARALLLVTPGQALSGAAHVKAGCTAPPLGKNGGLTMTRAAPAPAKGRAAATPATPAKPPASARQRALTVMSDAASWLREGNFERARKRFQDAILLDPRSPEAYNGVGVSFRMSNDLAAALDWYKRALTVDPDFGDAYYNLACIYAMQGQKELALRYLQIAAMNGYATATGIDEDPDLAPLREEPGYQALVKAKM
jgi:hypothetical protein